MTRDMARRGEWLLMYAQGLEPADIARICHTLPRTAAAYIAEQVAADPALIDRRLCRCLDPRCRCSGPRTPPAAGTETSCP